MASEDPDRTVQTHPATDTAAKAAPHSADGTPSALDADAPTPVEPDAARNARPATDAQALPEPIRDADTQPATEADADMPSHAPADPAPIAPRASEPAAPPVAPRGPSPWLALPIGAIAGAAAAAAVFYGLAQREASNQSADLQPMLQRLTALEQRPAADPAALAALGARLSKAEAATAALPDAVKRAVADSQSDLATLRQTQQALQTTVQGAAAASATASQQTAALSGRLDGLQKTLDETTATTRALDRAAASVSVLSALRTAILGGRPFAAELDAARVVLGPSAGPLDPFAAAAAAGYAPPAVLAQRLEAAAEAPAAAREAPAAAGGSMMDRFLSSAESLVRVRPADAPPSGQTQTKLNQAVAAVRSGDYDAATARLAELPPEMRAKLAPVTAEIAARRDAAHTALTLYTQALAAISGKLP